MPLTIAMVLNVSCPKDIDIPVLTQAAQTGLLVTYEDHNVHTGLGTIIADRLVTHRLQSRLIKMGVSEYGFSGKPDVLYTAAGLAPENLVSVIEKARA